jgi:hypothetical protein
MSELGALARAIRLLVKESRVKYNMFFWKINTRFQVIKLVGAHPLVILIMNWFECCSQKFPE